MSENRGVPHVTREQVLYAYVFLLGREPESEEAYRTHEKHASLVHLREAILSSDEYRRRLHSINEAYNREAVVFIHLEKTGGTTLHNVLAMNYAPDRASPSHYSYLYDFSLIDNTYDFFSCHIDFDTALRIPRASKRLVALFREPVERLISQYRFWKSHPVSTSSGEYDPSRLAKELGPEDFFDHPQVRPLPMINNYYLTTFGPAMRSLSLLNQEEKLRALQVAMQRVQSLHALGLTHRMADSIELISHGLGFPAPKTFETFHRTDDLPAREPGFQKVPTVKMTYRLRGLLDELTYYDSALYEAAVVEFDLRIAAMRLGGQAKAGARKRPAPGKPTSRTGPSAGGGAARRH
jgi:Sulfotransferase family